MVGKEEEERPRCVKSEGNERKKRVMRHLSSHALYAGVTSFFLFLLFPSAPARYVGSDMGIFWPIISCSKSCLGQ